MMKKNQDEMETNSVEPAMIHESASKPDDNSSAANDKYYFPINRETQNYTSTWGVLHRDKLESN